MMASEPGKMPGLRVVMVGPSSRNGAAGMRVRRLAEGGKMSLKGKTLFITGASRGIGRAIGRPRAPDATNIVIAAKTITPHPKLPGTIHTAAAEIEKAGGRALPLVVDVRDDAAVKDAIEQAVATFGTLDIVVNN